jgi:7,8-dihydropterin-6-yl-methyl-4-(beta-D-ribofuranosyl)aminobenzene 5'-phosphate synthase
VKNKELESESRREAMCAGGAGMMAAMFGGLLGVANGVRAEPVKGAVPVVDKLAVRVVTDSYQLALAPSTSIAGVKVERFSFPVTAERPKRSVLSEFGLSLHLESTIGSDTRQVLIDFGYTSEALMNNLEVFGIKPENLQALILSHGHFDHFGGMLGFLEATKGKLKPGIPFYLGGEECFCTRELNIPDRIGNFGYLDRDAIKAYNVQATFAEKPSIIAGHAFTTGQIARATFERVLSPTRMRVGINNGIGCYPDQINPEKKQATVVPDDFEHEQATCFNVKDRGLVVMTSCGHRGVVNSVKRAMAVAGTNKVHAVLGGFHLAPHKDEYVRETVMALKEINPDLVIPMHCTGEAFQEIAAREMPGKYIRSYTGTRYTFGA